MLGGQATAIFPAGGHFGEMLVELLAMERVPVKPTKIIGETRENVNVTESSTGRQYRFILPGPSLDDSTWHACIQSAAEVDEGGFVVVSGSLGPGWPKDIFLRLKHLTENKNAHLVVDSSGPALVEALRAGVYLVKPSLHELETLSQTLRLPGATPIEKARKLITNRNASVVLVSAGASGAMLVTAEGTWEIAAPQVQKMTTIGAGDCLVAGTIWRLSAGDPLPDAVRYGVACSAAAVMNPGTALCRREDADRLYHYMPESRMVTGRGLAPTR
jgi:6-phosphofructokinase 2